MDLMSEVTKLMVASYTNVDELMNFAATWGIQESPMVRFRVFQLQNPDYGDVFIEDQLDDLLTSLGGPMAPPTVMDEDNLELAMEYVAEQVDIDEAMQAYMFDEDMDDLANACMEDGDWDLPSPRPYSPQPGPSNINQQGAGSPQPSTSGQDSTPPSPSPRSPSPSSFYTLRKKKERTFKKNAEVEKIYEIKIADEQQGRKLKDIYGKLYDMFDDVLQKSRGDLADNDLGRVVIHHDQLDNPIVVPLMPLQHLNAETIMSTIEKVLSSHQSLPVSSSMEINVGLINVPKGGARRRITDIHGEKNSLKLKTSVVTIENKDQLCMARSIAICWAKLKRCSPEEWKVITKSRNGKSNIDLVLEHKKVPQTYYYHLINRKLNQQQLLATKLCQLAGVDIDRPASLNDLKAFEDLLDIRIMVVSARLGNKFITLVNKKHRELPCIYLYLVDDDHFHAITSITGFFSANYFCENCLKHFHHREKHYCEFYCNICKSDNCLETDEPKECQNCNMTCRSRECFDRHKIKSTYYSQEKKKITGPSPCEKWWRCLSCFKVINKEQRKPKHHRCGEYRCTSCKRYVMENHRCYLRAAMAQKKHEPKFIFFDFECSQDEVGQCEQGYRMQRNRKCNKCKKQEKPCSTCSRCINCKQAWCGRMEHRPNFVVAHTVCPTCIEDPVEPDSVCYDCGTRCDKCLTNGYDKGPCRGTCGFRETVFEGNDTAERFGRWLFSTQHRHFKVLAHNLKGYDGYFLLQYLIDQSIRPDKIIYNGSKIMYMQIEKDLHITVLDSCNFLPMKLAALPETFGLTELKKGYFPHYFNTQANQRYKGPHPDTQYYGVDFMNSDEREKFLPWYEEVKYQEFDFRKEMLEYCRSDVDILRQACLTFRELLMSSTGELQDLYNEQEECYEKKWIGAVDPFNYTTIASVCMGVYKTKFLEETWRVQLNGDDEWIPSKFVDGSSSVLVKGQWVGEEDLPKGKKITSREFVSSPIATVPPTTYRDQYSKTSIQWLEWRAKRDRVKTQHALNGGEKSLVGTRYKLDGYCEATNTAYEYHGCVFHGCPSCFPHSPEETTHPLTKQSMKELFCLTMKKKEYIQSLGIRYVSIWEHEFQKQCQTNAELKMFISSLDLVDRMDPRDSFFGGRTNASKLYYRVKDQERIHYVDFTSLYPWVNKYAKYPDGHPDIITSNFLDINAYFGIAKIKILPPRRLYHPVLAYRSNGKLKFPLCRTCADNESQSPCTCTTEDRAIIGTWCTPEIQTAVRLGYKVINIYEVYHWNSTTQYDPVTRKGGLFANYINTFLKFKQEASGPPDWIHTDEDVEQYISDYLEHEGVKLDKEAIKKNKGLRALAKLCLNSFWGKFGQRLNMHQTDFIHETEADVFFQTISDPLKQIKNFHIVAPDTLQLEWTYKRECQPEDNKTNIYLATFTTCWARLKLYSVLEKLNEQVLY